MSKKDTEVRIVKKDNNLIQKARYDLSLRELKVFAYICYQIGIATDIKEKEDYTFTFDTKGYCETFHISKGGKTYKEIWAAIQKLYDLKGFVLEYEPHKQVTARFINKATYDEVTGKIQIRIQYEIFPLLYNLTENYTKNNIQNWSEMKSKYSVRMHELLLSHYTKREAVLDRRTEEQRLIDPISIEITFSLENLKRLLMIDKDKSFEGFKEIKRRVLDKSVEEINEYSELIIEYKAMKLGRAVDKIIFTVKRKSVLDGKME